MILLSNMRLHARQAVAANMTWVAPQGNETLLAGQNYTARWNASSVPKAPTFQLCVDLPAGAGTAEGSCGGWVPAPVQVGDGLYFVSLSLPNVSSTYPFVLKMHDDPDPEFISPSFFIRPASMANGNATANAVTPSNDTQVAQAPGLSFQLPQSSNGTEPLVVLMPDAPHVPRSKRSDFDDVMHPTPIFIAFSIIPIVLLVGALVTIVLVWMRQRRNGQLKRLYLTDHPMIYPRRPVPKSLNSGEDLEDAVQTLSYERFLSEKPLNDSKATRIVDDRLKRRERRDEHERAVQGRVQQAQRDLANPFNSSSENLVSRPTGYVPEPRNLTDSYFPSMDLSSHTARVDDHGHRRSGFGEGESVRGSHDGVFGMRLVDSPLGMSPPPPSMTKLSERLHLRSRSESASGSSWSGHYPLEREEEVADLR